MTKEEKEKFHNQYWGKQSEVITEDLLTVLLDNQYVCFEINQEYSMDLSLDINEDKRIKILEIIKGK